MDTLGHTPTSTWTHWVTLRRGHTPTSTWTHWVTLRRPCGHIGSHSNVVTLRRPRGHTGSHSDVHVDTLGHTTMLFLSSRAAASISSHVSPILHRSLLTMPVQCVLGQHGPVLKSGTSLYNACCSMHGGPSVSDEQSSAVFFH